MSSVTRQTVRISDEPFSRWRFAKPFFVVAMIIYLLVPLKYLPRLIEEYAGVEAMPSAMTVAGIALALFGLFNGIIGILSLEFLVFISLKIVGVDIIFRDTAPMMRRAFFVLGCGIFCISAYLLTGSGWSIYTTLAPNIIVVIIMISHVAEIYRSLSAWGIKDRRYRLWAVMLYCIIPVIVLGIVLLLSRSFVF